ncbi:MAG: hypothetical protein IKS68_07675, partial [Mailhella sp.]|nr:hypothetical protein [Mailhella sp.]
MSQIQNDPVMDLDHYAANALEPRPEPEAREIPRELQNARPAAPGPSGWKTAGRVALGIVTCGLSEIFRLAYRGIKACCSSSRPAQAAEPRVPAGAGVPAADPEAAVHNAALTSALAAKNPWPAEHGAAIGSLIGSLRENYGEDCIPQGASLDEVIASIPKDIDPYVKRDIHMAIKDSHHAVSPAELQGFIRQKLVPALNAQVLTNEAKAQAAQDGGLGGLDMTRLVQNQLKAPGLKQRLESAGSKDEVLEIAAGMGLRQKVTEFKEAMEATLAGLRAKYGKGMLPDDMGAALQLKDEHGETMASRLDSLLHGSDRPVTAQSLRGSLEEYMSSPLRHMAVENALAEKARALGVPVNRRAVVLIANRLLDSRAVREALNDAADPAALNAVIDALELDALLQAQKANVERLYAA